MFEVIGNIIVMVVFGLLVGTLTQVVLIFERPHKKPNLKRRRHRFKESLKSLENLKHVRHSLRKSLKSGCQRGMKWIIRLSVPVQFGNI